LPQIDQAWCSQLSLRVCETTKSGSNVYKQLKVGKDDRRKVYRALVIDDEPLAREMIREMLEGDPDAEIIGECGNGRAAVEAIESKAPDLIFLDIQMPEMGGFEVLESLTKHKPYVIFVTAYDQYAVRAFEVHALDYLLKPYDQERFTAAWQLAKSRILEKETSQRDQHILALLEELKAGPRYIERLVIKAEGRVFFLDIDDLIVDGDAGDLSVFTA
jgi:two-component system LytT family response regulator